MALKNKKENAFFTKFKDYSTTIRVMGEKFYEFVDSFPQNFEAQADMLKAFESECDGKKHGIMEELYNSFVTPFDREDIFSLAERMDDVADNIEDVASKFCIYNVHEMTPAAKEMADIIRQMTENIEIMFNSLPDGGKKDELRKSIIAINDLEDKGDVIYRNSLSQLFHDDGIDALYITKWKDLYELLEMTVDSGEELADVAEGILTKNA